MVRRGHCGAFACSPYIIIIIITIIIIVIVVGATGNGTQSDATRQRGGNLAKLLLLLQSCRCARVG